MSNVVDLIDLEIDRLSLLKHPFYKSWSAGKLTLDQLAGYSKEYFQLVKQVPSLVSDVKSKASDPKIEEAISQNLKEETEHIQPWLQFARSLGVQYDDLAEYGGTDITNEALKLLGSQTGLSFEEGVAAMYAYEKELPKISRSKIEGLEKFYGLHSHDARHYFEIHEVADIKHAALWRDILQNIPKDRKDAVLSAAKRSLEAQNQLLDSVIAEYCADNDTS